MRRRRALTRVLAVAVSLTAAIGGLLVPGTALAQTVSTGSVSFSGDHGDYVSAGRSYAYDTRNGDKINVYSKDGATVRFDIRAANGDWWFLNFDAPGTPGRPVPGHSDLLVPGTYTVTKSYPFNGNGPGLSLEGNGRGAGGTGSFTIVKAVFGPNGYVQSFDATFTQYGPPAFGVSGHPAARGEVHISNAPPPPPSAAASTPASITATWPRYNGNPPAVSGSAQDTVRRTLLLIGAGSIAWVVLAAVGLTVGFATAAHRR